MPEENLQPRDTPPAPSHESPAQPEALDNWDEPRAQELYKEHLKQVWVDIQSSTDQYDKSILTFSSAGLGLSLAVIKDIVPLANSVALLLLYASWVAFGLAILVTISSFQVSIKAQKIHREHLEKYYLDRKLEYLNAPNIASSWLTCLTWVSGICFVLAVAGTITFVILNVREVKTMSFPIKVNGGRMPMGVTPVGTNPLGVTKGRSPMSVTPVSSGQATPASASTPAPAAVAPAAPVAPPAPQNTKPR